MLTNEHITPTRRAWWGWLALAAGLLGAGLRLWQWQLGTGFFLDELAVLHNLASRPAAQLIGQPLADAQVAPPLFLLAEKACLTLLGRSELALRLPALLAALVALPLLWAVARRVLAAPLVPLALLTFAVGFTFIYYGTQVKQYAGDVAAALLVQWLALRLRDARPPTPRLWVGAALAGLGLPFYSQAAVLVLAGCGAALVLLAALDAGRPRLRATAGVVAGWAVGCGLSLLLGEATLTPPTRAFMHFFWHDGLLTLSPRLPLVFAGELAERWANGLGWPHPAGVWVALTLFGAGCLWWRQREAALLLLAPWLVALLASVLQQFPLRARLMDFLVPSLILFLFAGWQALAGWAARRSRPLGRGLLALGVVPILASLGHHDLPPYCAEDAKSLYAQLARARRPGEAVYAYYGAGQSLRWYGPQLGLGPATYRLGHCYRQQPDAPRQYLREADAFRGRRVWVVLVHFNPLEAQALTQYLDSIGRRGPRLLAPSQGPSVILSYPLAYAQLYDLTDARRAARFAAATFPLPPTPPAPADEACWSCYGPQVLPASQPPGATHCQ